MIGGRDLLVELSHPLDVLCLLGVLFDFTHRTTFLGALRYLARLTVSSKTLLFLAIDQSGRELPLLVLLSIPFLLSGQAGYHLWPGLGEDESLFGLGPGNRGVPREGLTHLYLL